MEDLIKALQIMAKHCKDYAPTHCEHDSFFVNVDPGKFTDSEIEELQELGFHDGRGSSEFDSGFYSYRFGSC
jgi:hypothetical protein